MLRHLPLSAGGLSNETLERGLWPPLMRREGPGGPNFMNLLIISYKDWKTPGTSSDPGYLGIFSLQMTPLISACSYRQITLDKVGDAQTHACVHGFKECVLRLISYLRLLWLWDLGVAIPSSLIALPPSPPSPSSFPASVPGEGRQCPGLA